MGSMALIQSPESLELSWGMGQNFHDGVRVIDSLAF
jgi:hypothetical protein